MYQGRKFNQNRQHILEPFLPPHHDSRKARFISLDTFRGLTLTCMIFVNYGGGGYAFFTHSIWNGLTFADLLFPWFAYIMGFSVVLSNPTSFSKILKRSSKLFLLGLFLNNGQDWYHWRLPGVLQALSIANLIVSVANFTTKRLDFLKRFHYRQLIFHLFMIFVIVAFNLSMVFHLPVPGCPSGYLGPGGIDAKGKFKNCTGGAHLYLDTLIFGGHNHLYQHPTCQEKYSTGPFDPEGFLNWLMITATTYLGFCTAVLLLDKQKHVYSIHQQVKMIVLGGISLLLLSIPSCGLLLHQPWIPINKNLWSLSYVLVSTGIGSIVFACLLFCIDGGTAIWRSGKPFVCMGKNSIFIYVMVNKRYIYKS
jgi:heparan-alpha-glucosaminide N-acetyltransferase